MRVDVDPAEPTDSRKLCAMRGDLHARQAAVLATTDPRLARRHVLRARDEYHAAGLGLLRTRMHWRQHYLAERFGKAGS